jgi:hypothetical protein
MQRTMIPAALLSGGLVAGFLLVEVVLRVLGDVPEVYNPLLSLHQSDPELGWVGRPNLRRRFHRGEFDVLVEHSAEGFRRPDPEPPAAAKRAVLFLGDSFTWGWGVGQGELFTDWLQRRLAPDTAIHNRGVNAYGTAQEYLLLRREMEKKSYDDVAVMFFNNDPWDNGDGKSGRRPYFDLDEDRLVARNLPAARLANPIDNFFKSHSRAFLFLNYRLKVLQQLFEQRRKERESPPADSSDLDFRTVGGYPVTLRLLEEIGALCRRRGARPYIVYVPDVTELDAERSHESLVRAVREMIGEISRVTSIPLIDLTPGLREARRRGLAVTFSRDEHWNPNGHRLVADLLLESSIFAGQRSDDTSGSNNRTSHVACGTRLMAYGFRYG